MEQRHEVRRPVEIAGAIKKEHVGHQYSREQDASRRLLVVARHLQKVTGDQAAARHRQKRWRDTAQSSFIEVSLREMAAVEGLKKDSRYQVPRDDKKDVYPDEASG